MKKKFILLEMYLTLFNLISIKKEIIIFRVTLSFDFLDSARIYIFFEDLPD